MILFTLLGMFTAIAIVWVLLKMVGFGFKLMGALLMFGFTIVGYALVGVLALVMPVVVVIGLLLFALA